MRIPCLLVFILFTLLPLHLQSTSAVQGSAGSNRARYISRNCNTTGNPRLCYETLSCYARVVRSDPARLARVALSVSHSYTRGAAAYLSNVSRGVQFGDGAAAIEDCAYFLSDAAEEISDSLGQMREMGPPEAPGFKSNVSNVETWMSAAITYQETCKDELEDVADAEAKKKKKEKEDVFDRVDRVQKITSNALHFVTVYFDSLITISP